MRYIKSLRLALNVDTITGYSISVTSPKKTLFSKIPGKIVIVLEESSNAKTTCAFCPESLNDLEALLDTIEKELEEVFCNSSDKNEDKPSAILGEVRNPDEIK
jgi:hypothetical protein